MRTRSRIVVVWLIAAFVLAGAAVGFAKTGSNHSKPSSASSESDENEPNEHANEHAFDAQDKNESKQDEQGSDHERKLNHGFYVSQAAHCEDVDDPATSASPDFTAPADCKDDGKAHGDYVSSVAKSSAGKPEKAHGPK